LFCICLYEEKETKAIAIIITRKIINKMKFLFDMIIILFLLCVLLHLHNDLKKQCAH
jgi:hypothetical protein